MSDFCSDDVISIEEPVCMMCGRECKTTEYVWTGDENSYKGWELWCYCEHCKIDTFHKLVKAQKEDMIFYHGTNKENWDAIQREGILYGRRYIIDNNGNIIKEVSRCTYLATNLEEAKCYGDIILQVEYDPFKHKEKNNYIDGCWQVRVYEPIPISKIQEVKL